MYPRMHPKSIFIINHEEQENEYTYCEISGKIFNSLKNCVHESLIPTPMIMLIILFCSLKILLLYEEFPQKTIP